LKGDVTNQGLEGGTNAERDLDLFNSREKRDPMWGKALRDVADIGKGLGKGGGGVVRGSALCGRFLGGSRQYTGALGEASQNEKGGQWLGSSLKKKADVENGSGISRICGGV